MKTRFALLMLATLAAGSCAPRDPCLDPPAGPARLCPDRASLLFSPEGGTGTVVGRSTFDSVTLLNNGAAPLVVDSVTLSGDPEFTLREPFVVTTLSSTESRALTFVFTPTGPGVRRATARVASNAANAPKFDVSLSACGLRPDGGTFTTDCGQP